MIMTVEFDHRDDREPKCIARLVEGAQHFCGMRDEPGPTKEEYAREGHGDDPIEALEDLMLGDLRQALRRLHDTFIEEASP